MAKGKQGGKGKKGAKGAKGKQTPSKPSKSKYIPCSLESLGLRAKRVTADGNCLFRAVSDQLYGCPQDYDSIRGKVVDYLEKEGSKAIYAPFIEEDYTEYCEKMRRDGEWGGNIELQVISKLFDINITIHQEDFPSYMIKGSESAKQMIHLLYENGCHYDSVRLISDNGVGPAQEIDFNKTDESSGRGEEEAQIQLKLKMLLENTGCKDRDIAKRYLLKAELNIDRATEALIGDINNPNWNGIESKLTLEKEDKGNCTEIDMSQDEQKDKIKKPSRNRPCPCGSGKKYKACCKLKRNKKEEEATPCQEDQLLKVLVV